MGSLHALERLTVKERLQVLGLNLISLVACASVLVLLLVIYDGTVRALFLVTVYGLLVALWIPVCLIGLVQGLLAKRTALTAWNLDVLFAQGKQLPLPLGVMPHGYPHLATVRASLQSLYRHLSRARIGEFARSIPRGVADLDPGEDPVLAVQRIARAITDHLGLPAGQILVTFESILKTPGQVELTAQDVYFVSLAARYRRERKDIAAILAHEITHIFLFRAGLRFPTTLENEILTDVASVYLGIGWLVLDAYRRTQDEPVTDKKNGRIYVNVVEQNLGYLTPEEFAYVLAKRSLAFDEAPHRLLTSLAAREALRAGCSRALRDYKTPPLRDAGLVRRTVYRHRLRRARAQAGRPAFAVGRRSDQGYRFEAAEGIRVVFACPVCSQNLRLPTGRGRVSARCAVCESTLECET